MIDLAIVNLSVEASLLIQFWLGETSNQGWGCLDCIKGKFYK